MRRLFVGLTAFLAFAGTILVVPVAAAPGPEAQPVTTSADLVPMGSVEDPARGADVQEGTTEPVAGVAGTAPVLTVSRTDVDPFSLVGVTWAPDPAVDDTVVQIRVRDEDGDWGDWSEVDVEDFDQDAHVDAAGTERRGGTAPLWTGPSTGVEAELVTRSGAQPTDVQLDLIDPGTSPADGALDEPAMGDVAHAATSMPPVYSRAQWGADERLRTWGPEYPRTLKAATIHHTDTANTYAAADVPGILRGIYRYHAVSRGWGDIGYNVIADRYGKLWEGRYGGLASTVVGAHAGGFNTGTVGVAMLGDYESVAVPAAQLEAVAQIIAWKFSLFGIDPSGTTTLVSGGGGTAKYKAGTPVTLPTVFAHRDVGSTTCPGAQGYARMPQIRDRVAALVKGHAPAEPSIAQRYAAEPALQSALGATVGAEQIEAGVSFQRYERGNMYWTPTTGAHVVVGDILGRYLGAGGPAAFGAPTTDELSTPDRVGRFSVFAGGSRFPDGVSVYWTPTTGARAVGGPIRALWGARGFEAGTLGYPTSDERTTADGRTRYSEFQGGVITWSATAGARALEGDIADKWRALGGVSWSRGLPVTNTLRTPDKRGWFNAFAGDASIYAGPGGVHVVEGPIRKLWGARGFEAGALGYPTSDELTAADGRTRYAEFERGMITWTSTGGARALERGIAEKWKALGGVSWSGGLPENSTTRTPDKRGWFNAFSGSASIYAGPGGVHVVRGSIRKLWGALGFEAGALGFPTSDELTAADGRTRYSEFEHGIITWTSTEGARVLEGRIADKWRQLGGVSWSGGRPVNSTTPTPDRRGSFNAFTGNASIYAGPGGVHVIRGTIRKLWGALGFEAGVLGYPTSDELVTADRNGRYSSFQGGTVYWKSKVGAHAVYGAIHSRYQALGGVTSRLGYPTRSEYAVPGGRASDFERGRITWNATTGAVSVTYR